MRLALCYTLVLLATIVFGTVGLIVNTFNLVRALVKMCFLALVGAVQCVLYFLGLPYETAYKILVSGKPTEKGEKDA